jgi:hypothetical protein
MGVYDEVACECPSCGNTVLFQSNAGECCLCTYNSENAPPEVLEDIDGEYSTCENCGCTFKAKVKGVYTVDLV